MMVGDSGGRELCRHRGTRAETNAHAKLGSHVQAQEFCCHFIIGEVTTPKKKKNLEISEYNV